MDKDIGHDVPKISQIDNLIDQASEYSSCEDYLDELSNLIFSYLKIGGNISKDGHDALFSREIDHNKSRFISFCLLRVYSNNPNLIRDSKIKHQIHSLLIQTVPEVCKQLKIDQKTPSYEVENKFSGFVSNIEKNIERELTSELDLHHLNVFGNKYKPLINRKSNKSLLNPFFDKGVDRQSIDKVFKIIAEYDNGDPRSKLELYKEAKNSLESIIESAREVGTKYSTNYVAKPFSEILKCLKMDFESNPNAQNADLFVEKTEKKYPFVKGAKSKIQLLIINDSTGFAENASINLTLYSDELITVENPTQFIGVVRNSSIIEFSYTCKENTDSIILFGEISWNNFNQEYCSKEFEVELVGQTDQIDWDELIFEEPYDLEPVTDENSFVGRKKIISDLRKIRKKVSSSYIYGQRRVGKTSIVKTLQSILSEDNILPIYIEAGDWGSATSPHKSMDDLGRRICKSIKRCNSKFASVEIPNFEGSFNRLTEFLDEISDIDDSFRALIILDEFDRISGDLLYEGDIARSFMLTSFRPERTIFC